MQRHKSVEKRVRTSKKANSINRSGRSHIATATKKVLAATDPAAAQEALKEVFSVLDKSVKSGLIHKNKAANRKSSLAKAVNKLAVK
jgi:small subunit ribosomal protein S20